jgi:L-alanine-DL-glutamate epimerase-like enolase superfamily enzyme
MKIVGVETLQAAEYGNLVWVRLHTDDGLIGLGETFRNPEATVAYVHETCAPYLIGKDPTCREQLTHAAIARRVGNHFNGFPGRSVEVRGNSAVDIALRDLCGKAFGQPIYRLLGGPFRSECRIYNTCASSA